MLEIIILIMLFSVNSLPLVVKKQIGPGRVLLNALAKPNWSNAWTAAVT